LLDGVVLEGETREQRLTITPFPQPGQYATWEPYRQTIETTGGVLVAERHDPLVSFAGLTRYSPWDEFHVAYFASEANWNYFVAPFIFAHGDFITRETGLCVRNPEGCPIRDSVSVAIDVAPRRLRLGATPCALTSSPAGSSPTTS
jgi:hypothetical protein